LPDSCPNIEVLSGITLNYGRETPDPSIKSGAGFIRGDNLKILPSRAQTRDL